MKKFFNFITKKVEIPNWWAIILLFLSVTNLYFFIYNLFNF